MKVKGNLLITGDIKAANFVERFYTLNVIHSDDTANFSVDTLAVDVGAFYLTQNYPDTDKVHLNYRGFIFGGDHNELLSLDEDDHTQYFLADGTRDISGNFKGEGEFTSKGKINFQGGSVGFYLDDIEDVASSSPDDNDVLVYDSASGLWEAGPAAFVSVTDGTNTVTTNAITFNEDDFYITGHGTASVNLMSPPQCWAYKATNQTITNGALVGWVTLTFEDELKDDRDWHSNSVENTKIIVDQNGLYFVEVKAVFLGMSSIGYANPYRFKRGIRIRRNGGGAANALHGVFVVPPITQTGTPSSVTTDVGVSSLIYLNAGDYIEAQAFQNDDSVVAEAPSYPSRLISGSTSDVTYLRVTRMMPGAYSAA